MRRSARAGSGERCANPVLGSGGWGPFAVAEVCIILDVMFRERVSCRGRYLQ